ncbi:hypothetical protein LY76DRAFT_675235 [Colletotrichum caudatum]|nr:hypothetical protein LY76DRAFT_675235 [Colletotrichum caudatum]
MSGLPLTTMPRTSRSTNNNTTQARQSVQGSQSIAAALRNLTTAVRQQKSSHTATREAWDRLVAVYDQENPPTVPMATWFLNNAPQDVQPTTIKAVFEAYDEQSNVSSILRSVARVFDLPSPWYMYLYFGLKIPQSRRALKSLSDFRQRHPSVTIQNVFELVCDARKARLKERNTLTWNPVYKPEDVAKAIKLYLDEDTDRESDTPMSSPERDMDSEHVPDGEHMDGGISQERDTLVGSPERDIDSQHEPDDVHMIECISQERDTSVGSPERGIDSQHEPDSDVSRQPSPSSLDLAHPKRRRYGDYQRRVSINTCSLLESPEAPRGHNTVEDVSIIEQDDGLGLDPEVMANHSMNSLTIRDPSYLSSKRHFAVHKTLLGRSRTASVTWPKQADASANREPCGMHWTLTYWAKASRACTIYDPLDDGDPASGTGTGELVRNVIQWLYTEGGPETQAEQSEGTPASNVMSVTKAKCQQQEPGSLDCGIFVASWGIDIASGRPIRPVSVNSARRDMSLRVLLPAPLANAIMEWSDPATSSSDLLRSSTASIAQYAAMEKVSKFNTLAAMAFRYLCLELEIRSTYSKVEAFARFYRKNLERQQNLRELVGTWKKKPCWAWLEPQLRVLATWDGLGEPDQGDLAEEDRRVLAGRQSVINNVKAMMDQDVFKAVFDDASGKRMPPLGSVGIIVLRKAMQRLEDLGTIQKLEALRRISRSVDLML